MKSALLILNGSPPPKNLLRERALVVDFTIAVDGGANAAMDAGVSMDYVVGDFDSVQSSQLDQIQTTTKVLREDQNLCDFDKAWSIVKQKNIRRVFIQGAFGQRLDFQLLHTFAIWKYAADFLIQFEEPNWDLYPIVNSRTFVCKKNKTVSLLPFEDCRGVSLHGLKYELKNQALAIGSRGVSNATVAKEFRVEFEQGKLFVVLEK